MRTVTEVNPNSNKVLGASIVATKEQSEKLEDHPAWHGELTLGQASQQLVNQTPFSYIFSQAPDKTLVMTYMNERGVVSIATFFWEDSLQMWHYYNTTESIVPRLAEMAWRVMHCTPGECRPLSPLPVAAQRV